jgi:hypothetical protein
MGTNMNVDNGKIGNKVHLRTAGGAIGFGVEKNEDGIHGTWTIPNEADPEITSFLVLSSEDGLNNGNPGVWLATRKGKMHIVRLGEQGVCSGLHVPELYLEEKKAMLSAPTEVDIGANWTNGHNPVNYIKMTTTEISFEGSYADEDNQKNIYARFA